jgi:hypothetical protein
LTCPQIPRSPSFDDTVLSKWYLLVIRALFLHSTAHTHRNKHGVVFFF